MAPFQLWLVLSLAVFQAPDPVDQRASDATARLIEGDVAAAFVVVGDDELRNMVVLKVRDRLVAAFSSRDEETDEALAGTFSALVKAGLGGALDGQAQGEVLMWSEALWSGYIGALEDGYRVDLMLGAVLGSLGGLSPGSRVGWARRVLDRTGLSGLADAALGPVDHPAAPGWVAGPTWRVGGFLFGAMDAWAANPGAELSSLTPLLESRLLLDRLLGIQGLKRLGTPAAAAALDAMRGDNASLYMYLDGHSVGSQASLALYALSLVRELGPLRADLSAAGMDLGPVDRLRGDLLRDLEGSQGAAETRYGAAFLEIKAAWKEIRKESGAVKTRWLVLLRARCRRAVDGALELGGFADDPAWRGRVADDCLAGVARDAGLEHGTGTVFTRDDALAAVGLALKARERRQRDGVFNRARAYLRAVAEAAYETTRGREEIDGLTAWTMDAKETAAVVRRIVDVAREQAIADGQAEGPALDGAQGLLQQEWDLFVESVPPEETVMATLIGLRWSLLWRDAGRGGRSIHQEAAWARFGEEYWERHRDLGDRLRVEPYAREILEDLARDDEDVASLRWSLSPSERPLLERIRSDLQRCGAAAAKTAQRTTGISDEALALFRGHYPVLEEVAMVWLSSCFGETKAAPVRVGITPPKPPEDPMDLRRAGPPRSAYTDVVQDNYRKIRDCYDERRKRRPGLAGTLTVEIEVPTMGRVAVRVADDGLGDEQVARCVLRTIRHLDFPMPVDKVHVFRVPLQFTP